MGGNAEPGNGPHEGLSAPYLGEEGLGSLSAAHPGPCCWGTLTSSTAQSPVTFSEASPTPPATFPTRHEGPTSSSQRTPPPSASNSTPSRGEPTCHALAAASELQGPAGCGQRRAAEAGAGADSPLLSRCLHRRPGPLNPTKPTQPRTRQALQSIPDSSAGLLSGRAQALGLGSDQTGGRNREGREAGGATVTQTLETQGLAQARQRQKDLCWGEYYSKSRRSDKTILLLLKKETKN